MALKVSSSLLVPTRNALTIAFARSFLLGTSWTPGLLFFFAFFSRSLSCFSCSRTLFFRLASVSRLSRFSSSSSCRTSFALSASTATVDGVEDLAFLALVAFSFSFLASAAFCRFRAAALALAFLRPSALKSSSPSEANNSFCSSTSDSLPLSSCSSIMSASSSDLQRASNVYPDPESFTPCSSSKSSSEISPHALLSCISNSSSAHLPSSMAADICLVLNPVPLLFLVMLPTLVAPTLTSSSGSKFSMMSLSLTHINSCVPINSTRK
mmetsp:Transcript_29701/g.70591  ORF Transcript_29701/g.70591 Transcript_29701/m.70591 type:complete len:268 (-) Transcript_29701:2367-3170(-)